jgi:membrane protein DedA with SNARE-associated domain
MIDLFSTAASSHPLVIACGVFLVLLLCGFGLPLPEDIVLAFTGYVVHRGVLPIWVAIAIGLGGVLIGDSTLWWLGRRYGKEVLRRRFLQKILNPSRLDKIQHLYEKYGARMLFFARFTPVLRAGVFLFAGWAGVPYSKFLLTDGSAAVISVPAIITFVYLLGAQIDKAIRAVRGFEHWILVGIAVIVAYHGIHGYLARRRENTKADL